MKRHLNTLYVTSEGARLRKDGENVVVRLDDREVGRVPLHMIEGVVLCGRNYPSSSLLAALVGQGKTVTYLDERGRFRGRFEGPVSGNVLLRRDQFRASDNAAACAGVAQAIVAGKIHNQRAVLRRWIRDHGGGSGAEHLARVKRACEHLSGLARSVMGSSDVNRLRGVEGSAAQAYFDVLDVLLHRGGPAFKFEGRSRRPPRDRVNALLSFVYVLLTHDCRSAAESVGLDPAVGFLHRLRPGRPSLALDMMEELRPVVADRLALTLINRQQVSSRDVVPDEAGGYMLTEDGRKKVLVAYQERKRKTVTHPFVGESMDLGLVPLIQARLLARHLRGDIEGYPPFLWR